MVSSKTSLYMCVMLILLFIAPPCMTASLPKTVKISGIVKDAKGVPMDGAEVMLKDKQFNTICEMTTQKDGRYVFNVKPGVYPSLYAVKDYRVNYLEYWSWDVRAYEDVEINPMIDGLELYSMNASVIRRTGHPSFIVYFRPMSLKRTKVVNTLADGTIDIAPLISKEDITATINGQVVTVYGVNRVLEKVIDSNNAVYGYLVQLGMPAKGLPAKAFIEIHLRDSVTKEEGAGSVFWTEHDYVSTLKSH